MPACEIERQRENEREGDGNRRERHPIKGSAQPVGESQKETITQLQYRGLSSVVKYEAIKLEKWEEDIMAMCTVNQRQTVIMFNVF